MRILNSAETSNPCKCFNFLNLIIGKRIKGVFNLVRTMKSIDVGLIARSIPKKIVVVSWKFLDLTNWAQINHPCKSLNFISTSSKSRGSRTFEFNTKKSIKVMKLRREKFNA